VAVVTVGLALFLTLLARCGSTTVGRASASAACAHEQAGARRRGAADPCCRAGACGAALRDPAGRNALDLYAACCSPDRHTRRHAPD